MATLLLADLSESMNEPVLGEDSTRAELAQRGLLHFLQSSALQQEPVALMTFASDTEVAVPFSRDLRTTKAKLFDLTVVAAERRFERSLAEAAAYAASAWGSDVAVQVVVITDSPAAPGVDETLAGLAGADARLHFVVLAPEPRALDARGYAEVAQRSGGSGPHVVDLSREGRARGEPGRLVKLAFDALARPLYAPYRGELRFGDLAAAVSLYPDPSRSFPRAAVAELVGSLEAPTELPRRLRVAGFVPAAEAALCPCVSRHLLGEAAGAPPSALPALLLAHLRAERVAGLVALHAPGPPAPDPAWFALLLPLAPDNPLGPQPAPAPGPVQAAPATALGVVVLPPGLRPVWSPALARAMTLAAAPPPPAPAPAVPHDPDLISPWGPRPGPGPAPSPFRPASPPPAPRAAAPPPRLELARPALSYGGQRGYTYPSAAAEAVAADVGKVLRLARGLPGKRDALLQESAPGPRPAPPRRLKRLRETALAFCFPALLAETARLLADEAAALEGAGNRDGAKVAREHAESLANSVVSGALRPSAPAPPAP